MMGRSEYQKRRGLYEYASGDWTIRWTDRLGKQRKKHIGPSKALAMAELANMESDAARGVKSTSRKPVTFDELADLAAEHIRSTYSRPADDLARLEVIRGWFADRIADEVTTLDIRNALARTRKARNWSDSSTNHHHTMISLCYRLGLEADKVTFSPIHNKIQKAEENNDRDRHLEGDEEPRLFEALGSNPVWAMHAPEVIFAIHTGLRRTDMYVRLRWENIDLIKREAKILRSKNKKPLIVPLNADALACLNVWRNHPGTDGKTGRVIRNAEGEELDGNNEHWFPPAVEQAGISDFHWHDLRHTFASRLRQKGVPLEDIAQLLGHSRKTGLAMTLRYARQSQPNLAKAVASLETTIRPELGRSDVSENTPAATVN